MGYIGFDPASVTPLAGNLGVAYRAARAGLIVFPCDWRPKRDNHDSPTKAPLVKWASEATDDLETILKWWGKWPDALVGLPAGANGLVVIDADRHGGPDGVAAFEELAARHALPDRHPIVETLSGGRHYYFRLPAGWSHGNGRGALPPGIDVRGVGGFVVASGSAWVNGESYRDVGPQAVVDAFELETIPELPEWLRALLQPPAAKPAPARVYEYGDTEDEERAYIEAALDYIPSDGREEWFKIGAALHHSGYGWARAAWDRWSQTSAKFNARDQEKHWRGFDKGYSGQPATLGTLVETARLYGFAGHKYEPRPAWDGVMRTPQPRKIVAQRPCALQSPVENWYQTILNRGGLVADIAQWIMDCAWRPQPALSVASAIAIVGTVASRQLKTPTNANLNTFIAMIGPTSAGKDAPLAGASALLKGAGLDVMLGPEFRSDVGIYDFLHDHPVTLATFNEFGSMLASILSRNAAAYTSNIISAFRKFYDGGVMASPHSISRPSEILANPCLTILAASTPEQFFGAISGAQAEDGTLNRFMAVATDRTSKRRPTQSMDDPPKHICDRLRSIADRLKESGALNFQAHYHRMSDGAAAPAGQSIGWTQEADDAWNAYDDALIERAEGDRSVSLFGPRCAQNAIRVASILAIAEGEIDPIVTLEHVEIGIAMAEASLAAMVGGYGEHSAATFESERMDRLLHNIKKAGGRIAHSDLFNLRKRDFRRGSKEFREAIMVLVETNKIEVVSEGSGNGKAVFYYLK
jgi:hypothetical protein